jgi:hypothetical protein
VACANRRLAVRFAMPNYPCDFELPDEWWSEAGMQDWVPPGIAYKSTAAVSFVPLGHVQPPFRMHSVPKDWRGFDRLRLLKIFEGFKTGDDIEPVPLYENPPRDFPPIQYRFQVINGVHRFYASVAAGFECLPAMY